MIARPQTDRGDLGHKLELLFEIAHLAVLQTLKRRNIHTLDRLRAAHGLLRQVNNVTTGSSSPSSQQESNTRCTRSGESSACSSSHIDGRGLAGSIPFSARRFSDFRQLRETVFDIPPQGGAELLPRRTVDAGLTWWFVEFLDRPTTNRNNARVPGTRDLRRAALSADSAVVPAL
jgi:hypothetical protein